MIKSCINLSSFLIILSLFQPPILATAVDNLERITEFQSEIVINKNGLIDVTETITLNVTGARIKRGIFRELPTTYLDRLGHLRIIHFDLKSVTRNGKSEPHFLRAIKNGQRIYIGDKDVLLPEGTHQYRIRFTTDRQLGFFEDFDELYWNATGNGWDFTIDKAIILVSLPEQANPINSIAYTGAFGDKGTNYKITQPETGQIKFASTKPLTPNQGVTIAVSFAKGLVTAPTTSEQLGLFIEDNRSLLIGFLVTLAIYLYYFMVWRKVGIDPEPGVIIPEYVPLQGYSPAAMRYINRMGYDNKAFTSALINLARKGYLSISCNDDQFCLIKNKLKPDFEALASGEQALLETLFEDCDAVEVDQKQLKTIYGAKNAHYASLKADYHKNYYNNNSLHLILPSISTVALWIYLVNTAGSISVGLVIICFLLVLSHGLFIWLLKAPTKLGRQVMDKFEGLKLYLSVAEADDLNSRYPLHTTPEVFEKFLPFAIALDVEQQWAERFADAFKALSAQGVNTQPHWYHGQGWHSSRLGDFTNNISSQFNSAISQASTAPGSSSGSTGGGFSGGGGGGGGGGGW
jgi:uncharacterized membrane protein YgcG